METGTFFALRSRNRRPPRTGPAAGRGVLPDHQVRIVVAVQYSSPSSGAVP